MVRVPRSCPSDRSGGATSTRRSSRTSRARPTADHHGARVTSGPTDYPRRVPWRVQFDRVVTWRDWLAAISACSGRVCTAKPSGRPEERTWRIKCPGVAGTVALRDRGAGYAWDIIESLWTDATPFVAAAARSMGGTSVDVRLLARETPGLIDYVTGWWDDGRGSVRLSREPAGAHGAIRVLVREAAGWRTEGGESERIFDDWDRGEDRGSVDLHQLLRELRAFGTIDGHRSVAFEEVLEWLARAHEEGAQVRFVRST